MVDTSTLGYEGLGLTLLGGLTSAFGAFQTAGAQREMYDYQAGVANLNAQIARQNAEYARTVGELQATRYGMGAAQRMGQIKVAQSASGLDISSGSARQVQESQARLTRMDLTTIRSDAARTAYNYETQGVQFGAQAQLDTLAGKNAMAAGMINAAGSIIGTAASVDSAWLRGTQLGLWGSPGSSDRGLGA